ncbi:anti-sigma factor antagonist [Streptomyces sp. GMY01]|nr:anti-sigma factor antagonist [Streptomyces sp. SID89]NED75081.1 anti-sigma factor antagonist [Streptomyces sp. SID9944]NMO37075.1 anti-sigma factor antagonist [Streptomyces sp. GMY02]
MLEFTRSRVTCGAWTAVVPCGRPSRRRTERWRRSVVANVPEPLDRQLSVRRVHGHIVLEFRGEIDIAAAERITPFLDRVTGRREARVVIDLSGVDFFDCSGLRLLYRARARLLDREGELRLVCTHPLTLRVLKVTGLARLLPPRPTLEAALERPQARSGCH